MFTDLVKANRDNNLVYQQFLTHLAEILEHQGTIMLDIDKGNKTNQNLSVALLKDERLLVINSYTTTSNDIGHFTREESVRVELPFDNITQPTQLRKTVCNGDNNIKDLINYNSDQLCTCFRARRREEVLKNEVLAPLIAATNFQPPENAANLFKKVVDKISQSSDSLIIKGATLADGSRVSTKFDYVANAQSPLDTGTIDTLIVTSTHTLANGKSNVTKASILINGDDYKFASYSNEARKVDVSCVDKGGYMVNRFFNSFVNDALAPIAKDLGVAISNGLDTKVATR